MISSHDVSIPPLTCGTSARKLASYIYAVQHIYHVMPFTADEPAGSLAKVSCGPASLLNGGWFGAVGRVTCWRQWHTICCGAGLQPESSNVPVHDAMEEVAPPFDHARMAVTSRRCAQISLPRRIIHVLCIEEGVTPCSTIPGRSDRHSTTSIFALLAPPMRYMAKWSMLPTYAECYHSYFACMHRDASRPRH